MTVAIIGSGNVAAILGRVIRDKQHSIIHIASRSLDHADHLAKIFNCTFSDYGGLSHIKADIFLIAVSDSAISECVSQFKVRDTLLLHTAGSVSKNVLESSSENYGVLYPLQSLRKEMEAIPEIPFLIDGSSQDVIQYIEAFALSLSRDVEIANDEQRLKLHTAAVIVSNFTNHLYALAEDFCKKEQVNFDLLKPLILETAQRIQTLSPGSVQTGPALRKDIQTLDKHLKLLANYPKLRDIYLKITDSIMHA